MCYLINMEMMKKITKFIFSAVLFLFLSAPVFADVLPYYKSNITKDVIGFIQVPESFNVYSEPTQASELLETLSWNKTEVKYSGGTMEPYLVFAVMLYEKRLAFCTVLDEQDGWYKIVYDREKQLSGWIKPAIPQDFWNLREFYTSYGKKYGLYYFKDAPDGTKKLHSAPAETSQELGGFDVVKYIKLTIIRGNWALVSVMDMANVPKTGFVKWRNADGQLYMFPNFH